MHLNSVPERRNITDQHPVKNLRELCMATANEPEPKRLMTLVTESIKTLDGRNRNTAHEAPTHNLEGSSFPSWTVSGGQRPIMRQRLLT